MSVTATDETMRDAATDSVTFAFADPATERYGLARIGVSAAPDGGRRASALALLFAGREPVAALARGGIELPGDATASAISAAGLRASTEIPLERWRVALDGDDGRGFELEFEAVGDPAELGADEPAAALGGLSGYEQLCRVRGKVRVGGSEQSIDCSGQRGHAWGDPDWNRIGLTRTVTAWTQDGTGAALTAVRPVHARHHAEEAVWGALWEPAGVLALAEARLSTTYDGSGHMRRAGLELWPDSGVERDDWARRGAGELICGSSLDLGALRLDCAFFRWQLEGRAGVGRYDILRRA